MNTMKKTILICFFSILTAGVSVVAQTIQENTQQKPTPEQIMHKKWTYIAGKLNVTPDVLAQVENIFKNYEIAAFNLTKECRTKRQTIKKQPNLTNNEYQELNKLTLKTEIQRKELFIDYYHQLESLLSQEQLFFYFEAEKNFKRTLFGPKHKGQGPK